MTRLIYSRNWPRIAQLLVLVILAAYAICVLLVARLLTSFRDPFLQYASAFVIVQCAILAILGVLLIAGKHVRLRWEWRRAARLRKLEEALADPSKDEAIRAASYKWPDEFLTVIESALLSLKGSARDRVVRLLETSGPYRRLRSQTQDRDPSRAIRAISLLGQLDSGEAREAVQRASKHRSEVVRQAAHKAIMQGSDQAAQRALLDGFGRMSPWQRLVLFHFAPTDSTLLPGFIADALHSGNDERIVMALQVVITQQRLVLSPAPASLTDSSNLEIRIKFFKALPFLQLEGDLTQTLHAGLCDADWRVRAMAARACGHFRPAVLVDRLLEICRNFENLAEATHAARALAALGGEAWLRLQEVAYNEPGLARYIATEAVERHILGGAA